MQKVFEKIIDQLKAESIIVDDEAGNKAVEIMKQIAAEYNNGWILCSDRLPEENQRVIACFSHGLVTLLDFYDGLFHGIYDYSTKVIIAWQSLPEPCRVE